jgi:hypothetical protein
LYLENSKRLFFNAKHYECQPFQQPDHCDYRSTFSTGLIVQVNGTLQPSVDNIWTLPPNSPSMAVIATGNFGGSTVTITNITNAQNDAEAAIQCQTTATA